VSDRTPAEQGASAPASPPGPEPGPLDAPEPAAHRALPHTADTILQAWAATRRGCLREAVLALVDSFAAPPSAASPAAGRTVTFSVGPAADDEQLVAVLDEALYAIDALGVVPVDVTVRPTPDGGLDGVFTAVAVDRVEVVGAVPKAVAYSDLVFACEGGLWRCRFTVDV